MIGLIQRVDRADVRSGERRLGAIERGILALIGVRQGDETGAADRLLERLLSYRVFPDAAGRMNLSLRETGGGLLLVPQAARALFSHLVERARILHSPVAAGEFGADMQVELVNDGPVTFWLESRSD